MQISMFLKTEEAPAFNFLYRIISPIVFLFIVSAILYKLSLDKFVSNIYMVSVYYVVFRLIFNLLTNRALLMNWYRQVIYWISIITLSYYSFSEIIYKRENILPDFTTVSNELWIIILIFLFHTLNQIRISSDKTIKRKERYLKSRFNYFKKCYGKIIDDKIENHKLKSIIYSIMIYEDFNRPKAARLIENAKFYITSKTHSLGVMQVQTDKFINDEKSVKLGVKKIKKAYKKNIKKFGLDNKESIETLLPDAWSTEWSLERRIISDYNCDEPYIEEVRRLVEKIFENYMPKEKTYLFPNYYGETKENEEFYDEI